jgi:hypothetical protein
MKRVVFIVSLLVLTKASLFSQQSEFPKLTGPYLGQKLPGITAEKFAPEIVSTKADEYALEISPSGNEIMFIRDSRIILVTKNNDNTWNKPVVAPFSGKFIDDESFFSPDGKNVYFMSRRPSSGSKYPSNLWVAQKRDQKWMEPYRIQTIISPTQLHAPSIAANGNIYDDGIIKFRAGNDKYQLEKILISPKNGMYPFISPDESYIIFAARLPEKNDFDLFISFHRPDGTWSNGLSLGETINSPALEGNSFVTADGKFLFFSRKFDIYWVSANIIDKLRQKVLIPYSPH